MGASRRRAGAPSPRRLVKPNIVEHIAIETEAYRGPDRGAHRRRDGGISSVTFEGHIAGEAEAECHGFHFFPRLIVYPTPIISRLTSRST